MYTITLVTKKDFPSAIQLLQENKLPTDDITDATTIFVLREKDVVIGTIGIEVYGQTGLLRSLAVSEGKRNLGLGDRLVDHLEKYAEKLDIKELVLLTTTAAAYFEKKAYIKIERTEVPEAIKESSEFSSVCPSSAIVMKKILATDSI